MTGRPSVYTDAIAAEILERISDGQSLRSICVLDHMPARSTVFKWLSENVSFSDQYAHARDAQADALFEDMLQIADDSSSDVKVIGEDGNEREVCNTEFVQRSRLRVDTRKWMASKLAPKKYGEKVTAVHTSDEDAPVIHRIEIIGVSS